MQKVENPFLASPNLIVIFPFSVMSVAMERCGGGGLSGSADDKIAFFRVEESTVSHLKWDLIVVLRARIKDG